MGVEPVEPNLPPRCFNVTHDDDRIFARRNRSSVRCNGGSRYRRKLRLMVEMVGIDACQELRARIRQRHQSTLSDARAAPVVRLCWRAYLSHADWEGAYPTSIVATCLMPRSQQQYRRSRLTSLCGKFADKPKLIFSRRRPGMVKPIDHQGYKELCHPFYFSSSISLSMLISSRGETRNAASNDNNMHPFCL